MEIEPQLIDDCAKGKRKAQSELYRRCYGVLMGVCMRYHKQEDQAVAAMNMAFLKILNNLKKKKAHVPFEAWIRRITINTIVDDFRKNRKHRESISYVDFEAQGDPSEMVDVNTADLHFDAEALEVIIQLLPPVSREVFNLYAIDGYTHKEISHMLGISVGTSKWHVSAARKKIKEQIECIEEIKHPKH